MGSSCSRGVAPPSLPGRADNRGSEAGTTHGDSAAPDRADSSTTPHLSIDVSSAFDRPAAASASGATASAASLSPAVDGASPASLRDGDMSPQGAAAASLFKGAGGRKRVVSFGSVATAGGSGDQGEIEDEGDDAGGPGPSSPGAAAAAMMLMGSPGGSSKEGAGAGAAAALLLGKTADGVTGSIASKLKAGSQLASTQLQTRRLSRKFSRGFTTKGKAPATTTKQDAAVSTAGRPDLPNLNYGITVQYLVEFTNHHDCWDLTTKQVVDMVIKPLTEQHGCCRFLELPFVAEATGPATVFVVHSWWGNWGALVAAAAQHSPPDRLVWVDVLALRQWEQQLSSTAMIDALVPVLSSCHGILCVVEANSAVAQLNFDMAEASNFEPTKLIPAAMLAKIPFFRLWCVFELCVAASLRLPIVIKVGFANTMGQFVSLQARDTLQNLFLLVDTQHAKATRADDHTAIMGTLNRMPGVQGSMERINQLIKVCLTMSLMWIAEPALMAAALGNMQLLDELKLYGKVTPSQLHAAACAGLDGPLTELLAVPNIDVDMRDEKGYTALMKAAVWGHLAIVKKLADAGASCIASNLDGATPLMMARAANHASLVAWLQQEGIPRFQQSALPPGMLEDNVLLTPTGMKSMLKQRPSLKAAGLCMPTDDVTSTRAAVGSYI